MSEYRQSIRMRGGKWPKCENSELQKIWYIRTNSRGRILTAQCIRSCSESWKRKKFYLFSVSVALAELRVYTKLVALPARGKEVDISAIDMTLLDTIRGKDLVWTSLADTVIRALSFVAFQQSAVESRFAYAAQFSRFTHSDGVVFYDCAISVKLFGVLIIGLTNLIPFVFFAISIFSACRLRIFSRCSVQGIARRQKIKTSVLK